MEAHSRFSSFWAVRFDGETFTDFITEFDSIGNELFDGLRSIFAKFLGFNRVFIRDTFITRLLEPHLSTSDTTLKSPSRISISTIFRFICEAKDITIDEILKSAKAGGKILSTLKREDVKDLDGLRSELEKHIFKFIMFGKTGYKFDSMILRKLRLDMEVFYLIYKSTPSDNRGSVTFRAIRREIKAFATDNEADNIGSSFGDYGSPTYSWPSIRTLISYIRDKYIKNEISRTDYKSFLKEKRKFCQEFGISPQKQDKSGFEGTHLHKMEYNQEVIKALKNDVVGSLKKLSDYLLRQTGSTRRSFVSDYYDSVKKTSESFSASSFSKNPYSQGLGFTKPQRLAYIHKFTSSVVKQLGKTHNSFYQLIHYAQIRESDQLLVKDANLLRMIDPSSSYNNQPSHEFIQHLALKNIPSIFVTELWMWRQIGGQLFSGLVDFIQREGNKIRIIDYKPDLNFDPNTKNIANHFVDSIPQVAVYGILLDMLFGITASGLEIECVTFNENGYYLYDPYQALESSVQFYWDSIGELPAWKAFLPQNVIDKIENS